MREADYSRPETLGAGAGGRGAAATGIEQRIGPTGRPAQQRDHGRADGRGLPYRVHEPAQRRTTPPARWQASTGALSGCCAKRACRHMLLRNGYYTEVYTDPLGQYVEA